MPLHEPDGNDYLIGIFLVGAYQEILGDMHNLFGDTHAINVELNADGFEITEIEQGDSIDELLRYVHFDPEEMLKSYTRQIDKSSFTEAIKQQFRDELVAGLTGYTYHEE